MKKLLLIVSLLSVTGCVSKYKVDSYQAPMSIIKQEESFYVTKPENGRYNAIIYDISSNATQDAVVEALSKYTTRITPAKSVQDFDTVLADARQNKVRYIFQPTILHWEDRATEWSGIPDKITIKYAVYEANTGKPVTSTVIRGSSKWGTFGGDHPQDLLQQPTEEFVAKLF